MRIIYKARQEGKTTDLIKIAAEEFLYIVCFDYKEARRIFRQAKIMGVDIPFPITMHEFINKRFYGRGINGFIIDNVEALVQIIANGTPVKAITITRDSA